VRNALDIIKFHGALEYHSYIFSLTLSIFPLHHVWFFPQLLFQ
jgi:hypothetical protein